LLRNAMSEHQATGSSLSGSTKARKDKECPFCHQIFTSSSLGRHLDLYIKPSNPKPPDGIHKVDEIRKIRGAITRRQVKPGKKGGHKTAENSPTAEDSPQMNLFNPHTWTATGIISSLPPRSRSVSRQQQRKADVDQRQKLTEELDNMKAAEYALKEILNSMKQKINSQPFDFDPLTLNFPCLCLRILPPPSTLFSLTPFATNDSCSISPPGQKQFEALNRVIRQRIKQGPSTPVTPLPSPPMGEADSQKLLSHVADTFTHWKSLPEKQRQEAWQLEILRSFARAEECRKKAEASLESARNQLEIMAKQVEESASWNGVGVPPVLSPDFILKMTPGTLGLNGLGIDTQGWDYDHLVSKWKTVIQENRRATTGLAAQRSLSVSTSGPNHSQSRKATNSMSAPASAVLSYPPHTFSGTASPADGSGHSSDDDAAGDIDGDDDMELDPERQIDTPSAPQRSVPKPPQLQHPTPQPQIHRSLSANWTAPTPSPSMHHHPMSAGSQQPSPVAVSMAQAMANSNAHQHPHPHAHPHPHPHQHQHQHQHPPQHQLPHANQQHMIPSHGAAMNHPGGQDQTSHLNLGDPHQGVQGLGTAISMNGMGVPPDQFLGRMDIPLESKPSFLI
jgi:hypothetical protein